MAREIINVGATPNDGQGDPIRTAFIKTNNNFGELYSRVQVEPPVALTGSVGDTAGMTAYDSEYYYYCFANYDGSTDIWNQVPNAASANVTTLSATGNVTADYYFGDGGFLSNVAAGPGTELINGNTNITLANGGNANISVSGTANVAVFTTTGIAVAGNITASTLSTTGNVNAGNLRTAGAVSATGNVYSAAGLQTAGTVSAVGNVTGGNLLTAGLVSSTGNVTAGNVATAGRISSVGNINTGANVIAVGNVTGTYIIGDGGFLSNVTVASNVAVTQIANGTTAMAVTGSAGNIAVTIAGVTNLVQFVPLGIEVAGNVNTANVYNTGKYVGVGNVVGGNLIATSNVIATGNVTGTYINADQTMSATGNITTAAYLFGDGRYITNLDLIYGNSNVAAFLDSFGANSINTTGDISAGNLVINRISSDDSTFVFVKDGLDVGGDILPTDNVAYDLGSTTRRWKDLWLSNSTIYLGDSTISANATSIILTNPQGGQTLLTGTSGSSEITGAIVSVTGNITSGNLAATNLVINHISSDDSTAVVFDEGLSVQGSVDVIGDISAAGNIIGGNVNTGGVVYAIGNVRGANFNTDGLITATGNITVGNVLTGGVITATGNITAGNVRTGGAVSATGTISAGNVITGGSVSAAGNVVGAFFVGTATSAQYADLAENYTADAEYAPGTVLEFGGSAEVTVAADETTRVAGIVSTQPAHLMNSMLTGEHIAAVALLGRVPCRVRGVVAKGDMLISGGDGYARAKQNPIMGTVIGKALQASAGDHSIIEVVVGRL
jgi:filamentous hemagglutinin